MKHGIQKHALNRAALRNFSEIPPRWVDMPAADLDFGAGRPHQPTHTGAAAYIFDTKQQAGAVAVPFKRPLRLCPGTSAKRQVSRTQSSFRSRD